MDGLRGIDSGRLGRLVEQAAARRLARREAAPASAAAEPMPVTNPVGESGARIRTVDRLNSFLRMFLAEASHLPAHNRLAGGADKVIAQDVRLRVMVLPGGVPVAVAGAAETRARSADGGSVVLSEMAYVSALRQFAFGPAGAALGGGAPVMPPVELNDDSWLAARQVLDDRRLLVSSGARPLAEMFRSASAGALRPMIEAFSRISEALARLGAAFAGLSEPAALAAGRADSSAPLFLRAEAGPGAAAGTYDVEVVRAARGHRIESDAGAAPGAGTFRVNGAAVTVAPTDGLFDLVAKVNRGEDLDGDGELDAGEDADGNGRLDGGTAAHGVTASFYEGRLRFTNADAGAGNISLYDPDGVLQGIGMIALDANGQITFPHQVAAAEDAVIRVDGREYSSAANVFEAAIPGVKLTLAGEPLAPVAVTVERSAAGAAAALGAALEEFNAAMRAMNGELLSAGGVLARDPAAVRAVQDLVGALLAPVAGAPAEFDEAADVGVLRAARGRAVFSQEQLAAAARAERSGQPRPELARAQDPPSVYNALEELGITAAEDNTFRLDEERFGAALLEHEGDVAGLFTRSGEGLAARVLDRIDRAAGAGGTLAMRQAALEALLAARTGERFADAFRPDARALLLAGLAAPPPPAGG